MSKIHVAHGGKVKYRFLRRENKTSWYEVAAKNKAGLVRSNKLTPKSELSARIAEMAEFAEGTEVPPHWGMF